MLQCLSNHSNRRSRSIVAVDIVSCAPPAGDSDKEPGRVRSGSRRRGRRIAAPRPGQLRPTARPRVQGQSRGADPRQPDPPSWPSADG